MTSQRRRVIGICGVALAVLVAAVIVGLVRWPGGDPRSDRGVRELSGRTDLSLIVLVVDDMNDFTCRETKKYLPKSSRWLLTRGRCFENATATSPVCCPARAEIQSGQLPHNNRVERQHDAHKFNTRRTIQDHLGRIGLTTYGVGKFLNGIAPAAYVDGRFDTAFDRTDMWNTALYNDYVLYDEDGRPYEPDPLFHPTVRAGTYLREFVSEMTAAERPFFAYVGFAAPHTQSRGGGDLIFPEPTAANRHARVPKFRFRPERRSHDKLLPFHSLEKGHTKSYFRKLHTARARSLLDVDDEIAATFELLGTNGALDDVAVLFVSDNGYHLGSNGWEGKAVPYPDSINVPMLAYSPANFGAGVVDRRAAGLVDLAATVYDLFDVLPRYRLDGHSLLGTHARRGSFHEFTNERNKFVLQESGQAPLAVPTWAEYVTPGGAAYIEFYDSDGDILAQEYYEDPGRRRNLLAPEFRPLRPNAARLAKLQDRLHSLQNCAGTVEGHAVNPCL